MKRIYNLKYIIILFSFLSVVFAAISTTFYRDSIIDNCKYLFSFITIMIFIIFVLKKKINIKSLKFNKEVCIFFVIAIIFSLFSLINFLRGSELNNQIFYRFFLEIFFIIFPPLMAFILINILDIKQLILFSKVILISLFLIYILSIIDDLTLKNIFSINFIESYSPFESSSLSDFSFTLFCLFLYLKRLDKTIWTKFCYFLSMLFVLLTFKRVAVLFAIIMFILDFIIDFDIKIKKELVMFFATCFFVGTVVYYYLLVHNISPFGINLDKFTMSRKWFLSLLMINKHKLGIYGSTTVQIHSMLPNVYYLEMDLIKIYFELGWFSLLTFVFGYWSIIKNNLYGVLFGFCAFTTMFFSHILANPFSNIIRFLCFAILIYYPINREQIL